MRILLLLEYRARRMAEARGHQMGTFRLGQGADEYVAACATCGLPAIVSVHPRQGGIRGMAVRKRCRAATAVG